MAEKGEGATVSGGVLLGVWVVMLALAWAGAGGWLDATAEGIAPLYVPKVMAGLALLSLIGAIGTTVVWARGLGSGAAGGAAAPGLGRRRFLAGGAAIAAGLVATIASVLTRNLRWFTVTGNAIVRPEVETTAATPRAEWATSKILQYRRLGRTGFEVSDISLGSGRIASSSEGESIAREAIARGVNYFDTAPDYSEYGSEMVLGRAMKGHREGMFLATKFCRGDGHIGVGASVAEYMAAVEGSLGRLQTDYVDLVHIHSCNTVERLMDPNAHEAFDRLKQQGKARFLGFSSHTPNLEVVANQAIDSGRFDVMMLAYHHGAWPGLADVINRAHAADIGVVAMKTLKGAKHRGMAEFRGEADAYSQAAFKWVLSNPAVACLVISFFDPQHVDEYLHASGRSPTDKDVVLLQRYEQLIAGEYCEPHCGACLSSCPKKLAIDDVMRHRMYFEDYGHEKYAMELYAKLEQQADVCAGCAAPCAGSCPYGVAIQQRALETHELLTLA